jgi:hypothetical protein
VLKRAQGLARGCIVMVIGRRRTIIILSDRLIEADEVGG